MRHAIFQRRYRTCGIKSESRARWHSLLPAEASRHFCQSARCTCITIGELVTIGELSPASFDHYPEPVNPWLSRRDPHQPAVSEITGLTNGSQVEMLVVHISPEQALANTLERFATQGRGAGIVARIHSELPAGLDAIHQHFGDAVALTVADRSMARVTPRLIRSAIGDRFDSPNRRNVELARLSPLSKCW